MIILESTTKSLKVSTSSSGSIDYYTSYVDGTGGGLSSFNSNVGTIISPTTTTLASAPANSYTRLIKSVSLMNIGSAVNTVTVFVDSNSTNIRLYDVSLMPGWSLKYSDKTDWYLVTEQGVIQTQGQMLNSYYSTMQQPLFATGNATTTRTLTSQTCYAVHVGRAIKPLRNISVSWNQTTLASTITWAEVAVATGTPTWFGNSTLTVKGYVDISSQIAGTGVKLMEITNISPLISMGESVWLLLSVNASTPGAVRALSLADQLTMGIYQTLANFQPSANLGVPTAFTADTSNGPIWITGIVT